MEQFTLSDMVLDNSSNESENDEPHEDLVVVEKPKRKLKPRGPSKAVVGYMNSFDESEYGKFLRQVAQIGLSVKSRSAEDMKEGLMKYLELAEQQNRRITNLACYMAMGISKDIAYDLQHGRSGTPEQKRLLQFVKGLCATYREAMMVSGDLNPIVGIFWQKAYDGLNELDEATAIQSESNAFDYTEGADEIADKYGDLPE